jgi:hypothetical protein
MAVMKKNWQKDAGTVLLATALRTVGVAGGAFIANKGPFKATASKTMHNIGGPLLVVAGTLGEMMLDDAKLRAICQGLSAYGAIHSVAVISPDTVAPALGINGLGQVPVYDSMIGQLGAATTAESTTADPAEIKALMQGQTATDDGNDWAKAFAQADQPQTIQVNGTPQTAAQATALMGVDNAEEATRLMGMF